MRLAHKIILGCAIGASALATVFGIIAIWSPWAIGFAIGLAVTAAVFWAGLAVLDNIPNIWNGVIGSSHTVTKYITSWEFRGWWIFGSWHKVRRRVTHTVQDPNDGFIGAWHQQADGQRVGLEAKGASHMEMNKHWSVENRLHQAFRDIFGVSRR